MTRIQENWKTWESLYPSGFFFPLVYITGVFLAVLYHLKKAT